MGEITEALRRARREREEAERTAPDGEATGTPPGRPEAAPAAGLATEPRPVEPPPPCGEEVPVSTERSGFWTARATLIEGVGPIPERWRQIALQVRRTLDRRGQRSLFVSSSLRDEGKTVTACNLALALATMAAGRRVALVGLDLRRPAVARGLGLPCDHGIEDVLAERIPLARARIPTDVADLDVYPVASPVADAHRLLAGRRLPDVMAELQRRYALVVCDAPPVLPVPDVPLIAPHVDACLLVARAGVTRRAGFRQMLTHISHSQILGTVLNDVKQSSRGGYYDVGYGPRTSHE